MKGHVQDRWYRHKKDDNSKFVYDAKGRPVREKTALYGKGERYKVHYYTAEDAERNKSFPDKELGKARAFLTSMQHDVMTGEYIDVDSGKMTFRTYSKQWQKGQSDDAGTRQTVESKLRTRIFPKLGDLPLSAISTAVVRDWLEWMRTEGLEASYRAVLFDMVSGILQGALDDKKIRANPCRVKSIKRPKPEQRQLVPWPDARVHAVRLVLPAAYKIVVPLGAGVALRQMEIFGVSPDDIDRDEMTLRVTRQIRWIDNKPVFAPPKGGKTRVVPLGLGVMEDIDDYMEMFEPVTLTLPWLEPNGRPETVRLLINKVVERESYRGATVSTVVDGGNFTNEVWKPAFAAAGLTYTPRRDGMHGLRHFCASMWLAHGVSIKEVAEYLGHHDPGYTLRIYTHLVPSSHARARLASAKVFKPRRTKPAEAETA